MSVGAVQVLNVQNKPTLVSLSTKFGAQCDSSLSDVTWSMQETITAGDDNFTAVVSIHSMIFNNTFANIFAGENDYLEVLTTWTNNNIIEQNIIQITVPPGHYDVDSLTGYLSSKSSVIGADTYYYGLGGTLSTTTANPGFKVNPTQSTQAVISPPTAGASGALSTYVATHVYTGFYLIINEKTRPLLNILGLLEFNQENFITNSVPVVGATVAGVVSQYSCIGFAVFNTGVLSTSVYSYAQNTAVSTTEQKGINVVELQGPAALSVSWEVATSNARDSYNQLSTGNTIAVVPVDGMYGYRCIYEPNNPFKCIIPNFNVNQFKIIVRNCETGGLVDFQGSDWILNLCIEFYEVDNSHKSEMANKGYYRNVMPNMHNTNMDHTLRFSGTSGYNKKRRHSGIDVTEYFNPNS